MNLTQKTTEHVRVLVVGDVLSICSKLSTRSRKINLMPPSIWSEAPPAQLLRTKRFMMFVLCLCSDVDARHCQCTFPDSFVHKRTDWANEGPVSTASRDRRLQRNGKNKKKQTTTTKQNKNKKPETSTSLIYCRKRDLDTAVLYHSLWSEIAKPDCWLERKRNAIRRSPFLAQAAVRVLSFTFIVLLAVTRRIVVEDRRAGDDVCPTNHRVCKNGSRLHGPRTRRPDHVAKRWIICLLSGSN